MSATTKKKHVTKEVLEEYALPDESREVVKVTAARGNNLHEVVNSTGETFLVSMPNKFRKHVWIKRGNFIMVEPIEEGDRVKAEISHILFKDQIKYIQEQGKWPEAFAEKTCQKEDVMISADLLPPSDDEDSCDDLGDLVINMNRQTLSNYESESEDSCSEDEEEEEEEEEGDKHEQVKENSVCEVDVSARENSKCDSTSKMPDAGSANGHKHSDLR